jgi:hypothetical protein
LRCSCIDHTSQPYAAVARACLLAPGLGCRCNFHVHKYLCLQLHPPSKELPLPLDLSCSFQHLLSKLRAPVLRSRIRWTVTCTGRPLQHRILTHVHKAGVSPQINRVCVGGGTPSPKTRISPVCCWVMCVRECRYALTCASNSNSVIGSCHETGIYLSPPKTGRQMVMWQWAW